MNEMSLQLRFSTGETETLRKALRWRTNGKPVKLKIDVLVAELHADADGEHFVPVLEGPPKRQE